jgi:hypothetical protein
MGKGSKRSEDASATRMVCDQLGAGGGLSSNGRVLSCVILLGSSLFLHNALKHRIVHRTVKFNLKITAAGTAHDPPTGFGPASVASGTTG